MGTWGVHSFDNDDALEWVSAYRDIGLPLAASTIEVAISDHVNSTLNADIACRALAAVEAVAFNLGRGSADAAEHFASGPATDAAAAEALVSDCNDLIMSVTGGSELSVLWKDAKWGSFEQWVASLTDLRSRINGDVAVAAAAAAATAEPSPARALATEPADQFMPEQLEGIRQAIGGLTYDVEVLRLEMNENFARLAKRVEELSK